MIKWIKRKLDEWHINEIEKGTKGACSIRCVNFITGNDPNEIAEYLNFYKKGSGNVTDTLNYLNENGYYIFSAIEGDESLKDIDIRAFIKDNLSDDEFALILFNDDECGHGAAATNKSNVGLYAQYSKCTFMNFIKIVKGRNVVSEGSYITDNTVRELENNRYEISVNKVAL